MKRDEWKLKLIIYRNIIKFIENKKDIANLITKLFIVLKDVPQNELQKEFINKLAETIYAERHN